MNFHYLLLFLLIFQPLFSLENKTFSLESTFSKDHDQWIADFADYPVNEEKFYELAWGWENVPSDPSTKGLFLSGNNHSDDLFMFVKRPITGLKPKTEYALSFSFIIASNIPKGSFGIGGSPGESIYIKVGASTKEPVKIVKDNYYHMNIDKGDQATGGSNALVVGDLANSAVDPKAPQYQPKHFTTTEPLIVKSDSQGKLWIFLGSDSGYEGLTKFYLIKMTVHAIPAPS